MSDSTIPRNQQPQPKPAPTAAAPATPTPTATSTPTATPAMATSGTPTPDATAISDEALDESGSPSTSTGGGSGGILNWLGGQAQNLVKAGESAFGTVEEDVKQLPGDVANLITGMVTDAKHLAAGKYNIPSPGLPPYPKLDPALKQSAKVPGQVSQPVLQDPNGGRHEPISLIYTGSLDKLMKTLASQGWTQPGKIPISTMTVDGKPQVAALQKNAQLDGLSRDHLRIFDLGNGRWGIAATRDTQPFVRVHDDGSLTAGHDTDPDIDGERDLVMNDILSASPVAQKTWRVQQGQPQVPLSSGYQTDGQVYSFSL